MLHLRSTQTPTVIRWRAWKRAERVAAFTPMSQDWQAVAALQALQDEADDALLCSWPVTLLDAWCLVARARWERQKDEEQAFTWHAQWLSESRHGRPCETAALYADVDPNVPAAPLLQAFLIALARRDPSAVRLLRRAVALVREYPLPEADNELTLRHLEVALAFLSRPRAVA